WTAGQHISMVFYLSTGASTNGKPVVKVGSDGKAITAYMPFTTVAKASDATRSSAGYTDESFGVPAVSTTTTLAAAPAHSTTFGSTITLNATVTAASGSATGNVEFFKGATSLGSAPVSAGHAVLNNVNLGAVGIYQLKAVYTPTGNFSTSQSTP